MFLNTPLRTLNGISAFDRKYVHDLIYYISRIQYKIKDKMTAQHNRKKYNE
jgi:hypothetical protein